MLIVEKLNLKSTKPDFRPNITNVIAYKKFTRSVK